MKIAISGTDLRDYHSIIQIKKTLDSKGYAATIMKSGDYGVAKEVDLVLVPGGDRGILDYFHRVVTDSAPVLGIYESDSTGFLAQLSLRDLELKSPTLRKGDYEVDEVVRLAVNVDGNEVEPVLNDVAVFPSKSATLMEHVLRTDSRDVWHDNSDGVIISTPIGSTAYSMSAGGPMVIQRSKVFVVVSVNSVDNTRRPLIVPDDTKLEIVNLMSRYHSEVILDGGARLRIKRLLECHKHEFPAKLIRLSADTSAISLIAKKVKIAEDLLSMPASAKLILKTLEYEGALSQRDLTKRTMLPERTVRLSLSHLLKGDYVRKKTSLRDARQHIFELKI